MGGLPRDRGGLMLRRAAADVEAVAAVDRRSRYWSPRDPFPGLLLLHLCLGHRSPDEIRYRFADHWAAGETAAPVGGFA